MVVPNLGLVVFEDSQSREVLEGAGLEVDSQGIVLELGQPKPCDCCGTTLTEESFSAILPGSTLFYCERPSCLVNYVHRKIHGHAA